MEVQQYVHLLLLCLTSLVNRAGNGMWQAAVTSGYSGVCMYIYIKKNIYIKKKVSSWTLVLAAEAMSFGQKSVLNLQAEENMELTSLTTIL